MTTAQPPAADSYYLPLGDGRYQPSRNVQGAWRAEEQHMAPVSGLIAHELTMHEPRPDMQIGRISYEILGMIPAQETHIEVRTIRPGRTIELLEATMTVAGRVIIRARAWRLFVHDTSEVSGLELPAMPPPEECEAYDTTIEWPGGFLTTVPMRVAPGGRSGRRAMWLQPPMPLVEDTKVQPVATFCSMIDAANGVATRVRPNELMFPNVELSIHLLREPDPGWVGLDTSVNFGADGLGLTSTVLNDVHGPVGRAEQCLTLRPLPAS